MQQPPVALRDEGSRWLPGAGVGDVVFTLAYETYQDTVTRASFSPDLLLRYLLSTERVDRLLVVEPWRSVLGLLRPTTHRFPATDRAQLVSPRRLRRSDPTSATGARRASLRYVARLRRAARAAGLRDPLLLATHPWIAAAADPADWRAVVYYGWDDWAAHPDFWRWRERYLEAYAAMRVRGVRVVGVTDGVVDRIASPAPSATVPNGLISEEWLDAPPPPEWFLALPGPRILYAGTLDTRLDLEAVQALARGLPEASLIFVGTFGDLPTVQRLRAIPGVTVREWQPRTVTRGLVSACDLAIMPHVMTELTAAMSPLKIFEYLASGRPVVASDLPAVRNFPQVRVAAEPAAFAELSRKAIADGPQPESQRLAFIAANDWTPRFERLLDVAIS